MTAVRAGSPEPPVDTGAGFTLDADLLARRRAASAHRVHAVQIPQVRAAGMDDYMTKPVSTAQLAAAVQRWVAPTR